ncbi:Protein of unknown function [Mucilaginibacter mallensis]|uniref:DUF4199 domain-containing protein n=1 Tax=Mucilaginibacter mallensis TaxID=652787 RepID=A0A1H1XN86_MUCMA|nr:DUF4199 domain-containing protein [Mucilaginibacter mallensis]SDT10684.1 Protein of unknown function [Mucilaginibacter mallensis]
METKLPSSNQTAFKWAIIYVIISIVITYTFQFLNIDQSSSAKYLGYIPFIAFMFLAQKEYKDQHGGYITFSEGLATGFKYAVISGIIMAIFIYIYLTFLSPQIFDQALSTQRDAMVQKGMSSDQIDKAMDIAKRLGPMIGAVVLAILTAIIGVVLALIGAAIFKNEKPPFDINDETTYVDPAV